MQTIEFAPLVPIVVLGVLALTAAAAIGIAVLYRLPGWWLRAAALSLIVLSLSGPNWRTEERDPLRNVAFMVVDRSDSTGLEDRAERIEDAAGRISAEIGALSSSDAPVDLLTVDVTNTSTDRAAQGTRLIAALEEASARIPPEQIAGAVLVTDGQVHDAGRLDSFPAPVHGIIAGEKDGFDLTLELVNAPPFGIVDEEITLTVIARALGTLPADLRGEVRLDLAIDGGPPQPVRIPLGVEADLTLILDHGGPTVFDLTLPARPDELTDRNNRVLATVNGVRDRLRVLLVSGEPHPGGRTWRDLLKSDPTVELIHFTILRPPSKQDGTPVSELSLIAFPTRELFLEKISGFDLIVFDRYRWRGVLASAYLANVARYVEEGGAILVASGPAFAGAQSLQRTPLAEVLPARSTRDVLEQPFRPVVTDLGSRHPVTAGLDGSLAPGEANWGRWLRQIGMETLRGQTVMSGVDEAPLLVLDRVGAGRVALLASDHAWLWSRGYEGGGPHVELLRRVAHWLMKEPELEEEALFARVDGDRVLIERRTISEDPPDAVEALSPDGGAPQSLTYEQVGPGRWQALLEDAAQGLWRLSDSGLETVAAVGPPSPAEYADPIATADKLDPIAEMTGGGIDWIVDGLPDVRLVAEQRRTEGRGWIGLVERDAYRVTGVRLDPLLPAWLAMLAAALLFVGAWRREGR